MYCTYSECVCTTLGKIELAFKSFLFLFVQMGRMHLLILNLVS